MVKRLSLIVSLFFVASLLVTALFGSASAQTAALTPLEELGKASHKLAEEIYKQAAQKQQQAGQKQQQGPGATNQGPTQTEQPKQEKSKDDVIDAEYKEDKK